MRAFQIILFIILLQAAIGFTNTIGVFDQPFYATPDNKVTGYTVENLSSFGDVGENPSILDYAAISITWVWQGLVMFLQIAFAIVLVYPTLVDTFGIPGSLSAFIQVGIYVIYVWGYMQFKTGRSTKHME